jgi:hypothetical protein
MLFLRVTRRQEADSTRETACSWMAEERVIVSAFNKYTTNPETKKKGEPKFAFSHKNKIPKNSKINICDTRRWI